MHLETDGYAIVDRIVRGGEHSARIFVPKIWKGKRVRIVLLDPLDSSKGVDDEPLSAEGEEGLKEAKADVKAGRIHSEADIRAAFEVDDEPLSAEEEEELKEAVADVKAGNYRPLDDVLRENGLL